MNQVLTPVSKPLPILTTVIHEKNASVLITDDNAGWCEILSQAFADIAPSIAINIANNGRKLMETLNREAVELPDLILLDINMPGKNGLECLEEIKKDKRLKNIPIVIHSSSINASEVDISYQMGASLYMPKPDSYYELKHMLATMLQMDLQRTATPERKDFVIQLKGSHY
jgi:CheY-like chemotaxis protein